jgi:integrase
VAHVAVPFRLVRDCRTKWPCTEVAEDSFRVWRSRSPALFGTREPDAQYVFPHKSGPNTGEPVQDIKNGFHAPLELAGIETFTWHDLRHTFASWLMMRGTSGVKSPSARCSRARRWGATNR